MNTTRMHDPRSTTSSPTASRATTPARRLPSSLALAVLAPIAVTLAAPAQAYVGPGAGLGVIGTLFGIVAALVLALFGLFWYPLKRAFGRKSVADGAPVTTSASDPSVEAAPGDAPGAGNGTPIEHDAARREASETESGGAR